ncbi:hypothetical protein T440DRAFT_549471 [Plenodomus tracheiphilus IPT5]|uniref:VOC domain-containing protein n=1 Tax=Plenodomus tracheiphilus IPT5 TaxID=1408161 RepID=A0A6A7AMT1_9PLEO|nr:hypothetical protein T440DRAFT_549471 [Plenodomus tracheiphilus IPT5]
MSQTQLFNSSYTTPAGVLSEPPVHHQDATQSDNILIKRVDSPNCDTTLIPAYTIVNGCCVWYWRDGLSEAEGWIVIDSPVPTASGGGLFLHDAATFQEVLDVARTMSAKLAVSSQPHIVGAKGGIRFPSRDPRAPVVLERFIRDNAPVISQYWGTGGDINTDHKVIDEHAKVYCGSGTQTALDALRRALGYATTPSPDIHGLLNEKLDNSDWSLNDFSVGHVMATTLKELLLRTNPNLIGQVRLVVQGFGGVGATFAEAIKQLGIGKIIAISSQYGFIVNSDGIDCASIEASRRSQVCIGSAQTFDPRSLEAGLSQAQLQSDLYTARKVGTTDEEHLVDFLSTCRGHVFVPCAQRYVVSSKVVSTLINNTFACAPSGARFILAGANNIFQVAERKADIMSMLDFAGIRMLPEWISNSGTSNLFMRSCSGLALEGYAASTLEACANDTIAFVNAVFASVGDKASNTAIWDACESLAITRRRTGAVNLLGVKRMSHLTLAAFDVERSVKAMTQLYNAQPNDDGSHFQLPGHGDPTISVTNAIEGTGPAGIGFSVRFSVYSLEKARNVLNNEGFAFHEQNTGGRAELILNPEEAGYRMSICQAPTREPPHDSIFSSSSDALSSVVNSIYHLDHYATIQPEAGKIKLFHERMLGFTPIRTFTVNAGSGIDGKDDGLMHIMGIPFDTQRVVILTEGLTSDSVFSKLLRRKCGAHVHHIAMKVDDVDAVFTEARARGWRTTSDELSLDLATGLRQFFIKEEEAGSILEFIGGGKRRTVDAVAKDEQVEPTEVGGYADGKVEYRTENIVALARSLDV